jgi:hypothetical protein
MLNIRNHHLDASLIESGRWVRWGPGGIRFRVRSLRYPAFGEAVRLAIADGRIPEGAIAGGRGDLSPNQRAALCELVAEHLVADWSGVMDLDTNQPAAYEPALLAAELASEEADELLAFFVTEAGSINRYRRSAEQTAVGKPPRT